MGAWLRINNVFKAWFAIPLTESDRQVLGLGASPSADDQQVAEALCLLVALRVWAAYWREARLKIVSDNVGARILVSTLKANDPARAIIGAKV